MPAMVSVVVNADPPVPMPQTPQQQHSSSALAHLLARRSSEQAASQSQRGPSRRRVAAAMKLAGVTPRDLDDVKFSDDDDPEQQKRAEILQHRRDLLQHEIEEKAACLTEEHAEAILSAENIRPYSESKGRPAFRTIKAQVDELRAKNRANVQQKAAKQIEKRQQAEVFSREWQQATQNVKEAKQQEEEFALKRLEEKQKKLEQRLAAQRVFEQEVRRNIAVKLQEGSDRVQRQLSERARQREESRDRLHHRHRFVAERTEQHEEDLVQLNLRRRQQVIDATERVEAFREQQREQLAKREEERAADYALKMAKVEETMRARAENLEKDLADHLEKMKNARQNAEDHKEKVREKAQTLMERNRKKWSANVQVQTMSRKEKVKALKQAITTKFERSKVGREKYTDETVGKHCRTRVLFREVVDMNKERLQRSWECSRELTLANIQRGRAKHELYEEEKRERERCRAQAVKESLADRALLQELSDRISPKRAAEIMEKLGMPTLSPEAAAGTGGSGKEGTETEQNRY